MKNQAPQKELEYVGKTDSRTPIVWQEHDREKPLATHAGLFRSRKGQLGIDLVVPLSYGDVGRSRAELVALAGDFADIADYAIKPPVGMNGVRPVHHLQLFPRKGVDMNQFADLLLSKKLITGTPHGDQVSDMRGSFIEAGTPFDLAANIRKAVNKPSLADNFRTAMSGVLESLHLRKSVVPPPPGNAGNKL